MSKKHTEELSVILTIGGVKIWSNATGTYMCFTSDLDVCTDGTGSHFGDKTPLNQTAYYPYLNASKDHYVVVPPQIRNAMQPTVMGCQAKVTRIDTKEAHNGVIGEIGPDNKTGECAISLAKLLNSSVTANSGDSRKIYFYELWPGIPAHVGGKTYKLQPA